MNRPRAIALALTALIAIGVLLLLRFTTLVLDPYTQGWPPRHDG